ncbi:MAG: endonuclease III [Firmicutes bacterium]|nr:endonuclease III [Bacillota bacterium]
MIERIKRIAARLTEVYGEQQPKWPEDPLDVLVLTVLSQATTDANRDRAFQSFKEAFPTYDLVMAASAEEIARAIMSGGLAWQKAPRIKAILARLKEERGDYSLGFLASMDDEGAMDYLQSLPGIGPKSAACILLFAFGRPIFPVDTHIHRVASRLELVTDNATPEKTQAKIQSLVPPELVYSFHLNLIEHGRRVCKAQRPRCDECCLFDECPVHRDGAPGSS